LRADNEVCHENTKTQHLIVDLEDTVHAITSVTGSLAQASTALAAGGTPGRSWDIPVEGIPEVGSPVGVGIPAAACSLEVGSLAGGNLAAVGSPVEEGNLVAAGGTQRSLAAVDIPAVVGIRLAGGTQARFAAAVRTPVALVGHTEARAPAVPAVAAAGLA